MVTQTARTLSSPRTIAWPLLHFLQRIGLLEEVPTTAPPAGKVLARGVCPLHDGADNPNAFLLFADGFVCDTHKCHREKFGCNLHGLVRHLVYRLTGRAMDWRDAWHFAKNNAPRLRELVEDKVRKAPAEGSKPPAVSWAQADLFSCLEFPDAYYLTRGYRPETLQHFKVGTCVRPLPDGMKLLGWSVIPVLDRENRPVRGYTARNPHWRPGGAWPKWMHASGFNRSEYLFNHHALGGWRTPIIVCEGPGCVMRFHEAGFLGAVATFGAALSEMQFYQFVALVAPERRVFIAADNDEPGREYAGVLKKELGRVSDPTVIYPPQAKDFGDCTTEVVKEFMRQQMAP